MHQPVKHRRSFLRVLACLIGLALLAINAGRPYVTASTDSKQSSVTTDTRNRELGLQGGAAVDHLRQHGLFDRVKASVEASRYEIRWQVQARPPGLKGAHEANNPAHNLRASFTRNGVVIAPIQMSNQEQWQMAMKLRGVGYGDELAEITSMPLRTSGNRVELPHSALRAPHSTVVEWYVNKPEGIEQGFTLVDRPGVRFGNEPLRVALALTGGLKATLEDEGQAVVLSRCDGKQVLRYDHLAAFDALGRSLTTRMELQTGEVSLLVDDSNAIYPVTIDPVFTQVKKLSASNGAGGDQFGWSVGISDDTVVVGASFDDSGKGSAYVFARNRGGADSWGEVKELTASDGAANDRFGYAVGISGDTVVVGAPVDDSGKGSVYVFERNKGGPDNWGEVRKVTAADGATNDSFAFTVGISGDTVVVGAYNDDLVKGSAYVFERNRGGGDNWGQVRKLTASDGGANDAFGWSVGISGDALVCGALNDETGKGSAYLFERNRGGADLWGEVKKLTASDGASPDYFGVAVGISSETVVVGADGDDSVKGSAYIYERNKGGTDNWGEVRKLMASDGAASDAFGISVGISGDIVAVGARADDSQKGAVYIFERNWGGADNWGEGKKLTASDGVVDDLFGAVGISGGRVIVGARGDDASRGSAYIFVSPGNQWVEQRKQTASDGAAGKRFGYSIGISGDTVVVGAFADDDSRIGAAYIYERNKGGADNWGEVRRLTPSSGQSFDVGFGRAVGISGDRVVVGASTDDGLKGTAYIYERNKGGADNWGEVQILRASDGATSDFFGFAVGIGGDTVVVGATGDDSDRGSAYVFERNKGGADNWGEVRKLTASDGGAADQLGFAVGISGDTVVVAATADEMFKGSAYIYERNKGGADNWGEVKKLNASDGEGAADFGRSVGISGDTVIAGARAQGGNGAAYLYERNKGGADNWGEVKKLTASDGVVFDAFGSWVGISGDTVVGGAPGDDSQSKGAAYVFERNNGGADNWGEVRKVTASDGVGGDSFGSSIGISGETIVVGAPGDDSKRGSAYIFTVFPEAVSVSAASFQRTALAPEMIVAAFGIDLATGTAVAGTIPLPTNLLGTTLTVTDSAGMERLGPLFFVSPGQVNYYVPAGTAIGPATVKITSGSGQISFGMVEIAAISPGIFSANSTGQGIAAALALRVRGAQQTYEQISAYDSGTSSFVPIPIDLGPAGDQVFLIMYGTGFRFRSSDSAVSVKVGGRTLQSLFSGMVGGFVGLDQMNISPLPRDLAGAGVINIEITVDGKPANTTTVSIR